MSARHPRYCQPASLGDSSSRSPRARRGVRAQDDTRCATLIGGLKFLLARYFDVLLREGEDATEAVSDEYADVRASSDHDYEGAAVEMAGKQPLNAEETSEIKKIWRKLVRLFHPDRLEGQPEKVDAYTALTSAINKAKDDGDLATMRDIASDPNAYMVKQGWQGLDFDESKAQQQLERLLGSLRAETLSILEAHNSLRESA